MTAEEVDTEHGSVEVKPVFVNGVKAGESVWVKGHLVGHVVELHDGNWRAATTGLPRRDQPDPYVRRIDAIQFLAGVGRERYGYD